MKKLILKSLLMTLALMAVASSSAAEEMYFMATPIYQQTEEIISQMDESDISSGGIMGVGSLFNYSSVDRRAAALAGGQVSHTPTSIILIERESDRPAAEQKRRVAAGIR